MNSDGSVAPSPQVPQDLHVHTTFSSTDSAVVPEQTLERIAAIRHARVLGISDHLESLGETFEDYARSVRLHGLRLGIEVNGAEWVGAALERPVEYYLYHCRDRAEDYDGAGLLLESGRPVIIAHPVFLGTDLARVPPDCLIEINNRYVWRGDWQTALRPHLERFRFVIGSDAHQPHWLNQTVARDLAARLGIVETILFP
ncbi:MAG: PHP domain-containing protein [Spirochaetales bacterium]|nr:PHP domain-containing protein [Spirochaetales bacterium]